MKHCIILTIIGIGLLSCDSNLNSPGRDVNDPYVIGNYWVYDDEAYDDQGAVVEKIEDSLAVVSRGVESGVDKIIFNDSSSYCKRQEGLFDPSNCILLFKYPAVHSDTTYRSSSMVKIGGVVYPATLISFVESIEIPVVVPAGAFTANKYRFQIFIEDSTLMYDMVTHFVPTAGIIKVEYFRPSKAGLPLRMIGKRELLRFKISNTEFFN